MNNITEELASDTLSKTSLIPLQARLAHKKFKDHAISTHRFKQKKMERTVDAVEAHIVQLFRVQEGYLVPRVSLQPKFCAFTFFLEGCSRKLLMYIIFYEMDPRTATFPYNAIFTERFRDYCELFDEKPYSKNVVKQAIRTLVNMNIIQNVARMKYMVNPLLLGFHNDHTRKEVINEYSYKLIEKGKDTSIDFYPRYSLKEF